MTGSPTDSSGTLVVGVTGIAGVAGSTLTDLLVQQRWPVRGFSRRAPPNRTA